MIQITYKCQYKAASDSFLLLQTHAQNGEHRLAKTSRSKHFIFEFTSNLLWFGDTEGDEEITLFCSNPTTHQCFQQDPTGLTPHLTACTCGVRKSRASYLQDGALKQAMLKRVVGGLQNSFVGTRWQARKGSRIRLCKMLVIRTWFTCSVSFILWLLVLKWLSCSLSFSCHWRWHEIWCFSTVDSRDKKLKHSVSQIWNMYTHVPPSTYTQYATAG